MTAVPAEDSTEPECDNPRIDGTCPHLICGRCNQHTNNSHQGHYWAFCHVDKHEGRFHFCCPGDCELHGAGQQADATSTATQPQES